MKISVNGKERPLDKSISIQELLLELKLENALLAVECNQQIVPKAEHASHMIADGDAIEIVHFVGGG